MNNFVAVYGGSTSPSLKPFIKKQIKQFKTTQINTLPRVICESEVFFTTSPGV